MAKTPVIFVPGLGGSFNLMVMLDWRGPGLSGWDFPPFIQYGKTFLSSFQQAGYTRDVDLFVAFYDWRKSVGDSATNYLVPWIERAKQRSGSSKVILVGHSMGGLVSRAYIQSDAYRNDVERLITLGTPHRGSANSYYPWEGGELTWSGAAKAALDVYLWYLEHIHPFQTGLNKLKTIRTQAPGVRDLLPLDDYVTTKGPPAAARAIALMKERNLLGDMMLTPRGLEMLLTRVPLTTVNGSGFDTVQRIFVGGAPTSGDQPAPYIDGTPDGDEKTSAGDGTVLLSSAAIDDTRVRNLPAVACEHDQLPDRAFDRVLRELGATPPAGLAAPAPVPQLVIMTASPVELIVETPASAPAVLGEGETQGRRRRVRARNYGHRGKRLNIVVVPQPVAGMYNVRLRGTADGAFALGALIVGGAAEPAVLSDDGTPSSAPTINTAQGQVAAETELHYQIEVTTPTAAPQVRFDADATARDALARLSEGAAAPGPMVLGDEPPVSTVGGVLSADETPDDLRALLTAALVQRNSDATDRLIALVRSADDATLRLLLAIAEQVLGPTNSRLALGLIEQLRQVALSG